MIHDINEQIAKNIAATRALKTRVKLLRKSRDAFNRYGRTLAMLDHHDIQTKRAMDERTNQGRGGYHDI